MAHLKKFTKGAIGHMMAHFDRSVGERNGNVDINHKLTKLNYNLADSIQPKGQIEFINQRLSEVKVQNRKDVNIFCDWVVTAPINLKEEDEQEFFRSCFDLLTERYGKENVISAYVHKDEVTPHLHFAFLPIVQDKKNPDREKLSAKECVNRTDLRTFHGHLNEHLKITLGYEVAILNGATSKGNKEIIELKTETAQENLENTLQRLSDAENEVLTHKDELEGLKAELEPLQAKLSDYHDLNFLYNLLQKHLNEKKLENKLLIQKNNELQNKIDNQLTEIEKLKQDISKTSVNVLKNEESSQVQKDVLHKIRSEIEVLQAKMDNNKLLQFHIYNYLKTRDIYNQYTNQAVNSKKFYTNHEHEIDLHKKAKEYFNTLNVKKLPSLQYLRAEFSDLVQQKDFLSADLKRAKEIEKKHEEPRRFISSNYDMER